MSEHRIYKLIKLLVTGLSLLPKPVLSFCSDALGLIWYRFDRRHRDVVLENVQQAFPGKFSESGARVFAKNNFKHIAGILFEVIWSYSKPPEELFRHVTVRGGNHFKTALEKGKGVVLLGGHMGNFELLSIGVAKAGIKPWGLYRKLDFRPLDRLLLEIRERFDTRMIPIRKASGRIETLLRKGDVVATLLDQNVDWYKGVFADYFGRPACTNNGLAKLVLRTGAAVVPMFIRKENNQFVFEILPEISVKKTGDPIKDVENTTQAFVSTIEFMVRHAPEQYFWVHNRWKTKAYSLIGSK